MTIDEKLKALAQAMGIIDSDRRTSDEKIEKLTQFCSGILSRIDNHESIIKKLQADIAEYERTKDSPSKSKKRVFTYEMWKRVQDLKASGISITNISGMLNVPRSSVGKYLKLTETEVLALPHEENVEHLPLPDSSVSLRLEDKYE